MEGINVVLGFYNCIGYRIGVKNDLVCNLISKIFFVIYWVGSFGWIRFLDLLCIIDLWWYWGEINYLFVFLF